MYLANNNQCMKENISAKQGKSQHWLSIEKEMKAIKANLPEKTIMAGGAM